jgi:Na+-driven multidrug efflux pump
MPRIGRDIVEGPLRRPLLRLAFPMLAGFLFQIGFNLVDTFYVASLGKDALAAVGSMMFVVVGGLK